MMVWVLVAIILGCIVYCVRTLGEYRVFVAEIEAKIDGLVAKADQFEEGALEETERRNQGRQRVRDLKDLISKVQREVRLVETKIVKSREEYEQLELHVHKMDFENRR